MISTRMLINTITVVFLSLGIGILLGGTGGHSWLKQQEGALLEKLEKRIDQVSEERGRLRKELNNREEVLLRLRGQNRTLLKEALRGRLKDRLVLVLGGSEREAGKLGEAIRLAGGIPARQTFFPTLPDRFDAIVLLTDSRQKSPRLRETLQDVRMTYSGPVLVQRSGERSRPVFGIGEDRSYSFPGPYTGDPLQTCELIELIQDATKRGKEAAS